MEVSMVTPEKGFLQQNHQRITRRYKVNLDWNKPEEENDIAGYTVTIPSLPPVVTEGDTREEALENAREAIACYLEYLTITDQPVPESDTEGENMVEVCSRLPCVNGIKQGHISGYLNYQPD